MSEQIGGEPACTGRGGGEAERGRTSIGHVQSTYSQHTANILCADGPAQRPRRAHTAHTGPTQSPHRAHTEPSQGPPRSVDWERVLWTGTRSVDWERVLWTGLRVGRVGRVSDAASEVHKIDDACRM